MKMVRPDDDDLVAFLVEYIRQQAGPRGMMNAAARRWGVDRRTIARWVDRLRQRGLIGRGVFRDWRDSP